MSGKNGYKAEQFIKAIPGSGGIVSTIAKRVGCDWQTADKYIKEFATVQLVYQAEKETIKDMAEGTVVANIKLAMLAQRTDQEQQDTGDAKWYLSKMAKDRGYGDKIDVGIKVEKELDLILDTLEKGLNQDEYNRVLKLITAS